MRLVQRFWADRSGATAIEYCFLGGSIALAIVVGVTSIGTKLNQYFVQVGNGLR